MVTKKLQEQWRKNIYDFCIRAVIIVFGVFCCIQVYLHGPGTQGKEGRLSFLYQLEEQGHPGLVKWVVIGIFVFCICYTLPWLVYSLLHITPKLTKLGRSIRRQASPQEKFEDLCTQIDQDMEGGCKELGTGIFVSSSWILEDEVMRLKRVRRISEKRGFGKNGLVLEDVDGNCMTLDFVLKGPMEEALEYLKKRLPMAEIEAEGKSDAPYRQSIIESTDRRSENMNNGKMLSWHTPKTAEQVETYKKQAEQGDAYAQTEYGKCLLFGKAGEPDGKAAYEWFQKAAGQSNEVGKMYVGHCVMYGIGVEKDEIKGYEMLNAALEYNYPEESSSQPLADYSQFQEEDLVQLFWDLGDALEKSMGVIRNYKVAVYYFEMIADWGYAEGNERMKHYKKGIFGWKKID